MTHETHEVKGQDGLVFSAGYLVKCACNPQTGNRCQFHARLQPRACPEGCGGHLTRMTGNDAFKVTYNKYAGRNLKSSAPVWVCNTCEHCE